MTNNKDLNYIAECAESVGIHVDEHTAISIPFIADVMRKMREQSKSDEDFIRFPKGALKMRGEGYVVYNYDWLKENWQTELKVMGVEPSVQPKPKTGYWEWVQYDSNPEIGNFHCSECNFMPASFNWASKHLKYCPNCGAKMESEGKE